MLPRHPATTAQGCVDRQRATDLGAVGVLCIRAARPSLCSIHIHTIAGTKQHFVAHC